MNSVKSFIFLIFVWFYIESISCQMLLNQESTGIKSSKTHLLYNQNPMNMEETTLEIQDARIITSPMRCRPGERLDRRRQICRRVIHVN